MIEELKQYFSAHGLTDPQAQQEVYVQLQMLALEYAAIELLEANSLNGTEIHLLKQAIADEQLTDQTAQQLFGTPEREAMLQQAFQQALFEILPPAPNEESKSQEAPL